MTAQEDNLVGLMVTVSTTPLAVKLAELMARGYTALLDPKWVGLMAIEFMTVQVIK